MNLIRSNHLTSRKAVAPASKAFFGGLSVLLVSGLFSVGAFGQSCDAVNLTSPGTSTCTVPAGVTGLIYTVVGGDGGSATSPGGKGAQITGTLTVTPGATLYLAVGGNGGASGGNTAGGGGGGYSSISTTSLLAGPVVIAAGGGGAKNGASGGNYETSGAGANPGGAGNGSTGGGGGADTGTYGAGGTGGNSGGAGAVGTDASWAGGGGGGGGFGGAGASGGSATGWWCLPSPPIVNGGTGGTNGGGGGGSSCQSGAPGAGGGGGGYAGGGGGGSGGSGGGGSNLVPGGGSVSAGDGTPRIVLALPNTAPTATPVAIGGTAQVGVQLTGNYTYGDTESDPQGTSTFRWVQNNVNTGVGGGVNVAITQNYTAVAGDQGKYLYFCVIPVASAGTSPGAEACTSASTAVAAANAAPAASAVATTGTAQVGVQLSGSYTYADAESNPQGTSTFRWVQNSGNTGVGGGVNVAITQNYSAVAGDQGKYLYFCVTPVASAGTTTGTEACSSATAAVAAVPVVTPAPPANPIPTVITPPPVAGVGGNQLSPLNLSSGDGPTMTICLRDQLRTVIGANAVYQGQAADGGARIGQTGLLVSFYALDATTSTNNGLGQGAGIYLRGSNPLNVVTSCGTFTTTPAVYNLTEWGAFLNGMGLSAQFNAQGVMTVVVGATTYVARPDYSVTQGDPGAPRLITGSDGLMRFTDSAGNTQILYPAFIDPETLGNQVAQAVGGWTVIQTDGTALVTLWSGQKFVLIPDMTLGTVPPEQLTAGWWQDGPNHYRYRNSSFAMTSQGFTVRAVP